MSRTITFALTMIALVLSPGEAAVLVDLAVTSPALSIWGATGTELGTSLVIADFNGDGVPDLAIAEPIARDPGDLVTLCLYWGPLPLPLRIDRAVDSPQTCITPSTTGGAMSMLATADFDGDGIADLIAGDPLGGSTSFEGVVSVFRGRASWPPRMSRSDADWTFRGRDKDDHMDIGIGGDLNGDSWADIVLFAAPASGLNNLRYGAGEAYIFFGPATSWKPVTDLAMEISDVIIYGADGTGDRNPFGVPPDRIGNYGGALVADILGDPIPDLIFASYSGQGPGENLIGPGEVYVLRGRPVWPPVIDLRNPGSTDFIVYGPSENSHVYWPAVGDLDGDGKPDLALGAPIASHGTGRVAPGAIYLFRGGALSGARDLATTSADATIVGSHDWANIGWHVAIGDINGDGLSDIVTGSPQDSPLGRGGAGAISVVSGCAGFPRSRDLATDPADLKIIGADFADQVGEQLAVGDVDGDGKDDIFFGNHRSSSLGGLRPYGGEAHLVLGRPFDAVCTIAPDAGPAVDLCGVADVTLDASRSVTTGCSLMPQYRWLAGAVVVRDWDAAPTTVVRPMTSTTYRLEVRCGDCAGPCFAATTVDVNVDPDVTPPTLDNTLEALRAGSDVVLEWGTVAEARSYSIFRAIVKETWPMAPMLEDLAAPMTTLPDVPAPPNEPLYFYRAAGANCSGVEGP